MPHHVQYKKSIRQDAKRRVRNRTQRARLRHAVRDLRELDTAKTAESALPGVAALLDKAAKTRLIHPRRAARLKSRLARHVNRQRAAKA